MLQSSYTIRTNEEFISFIAHEPFYGTPMLPYSQDADFEELNHFFKNKSVAIVGPAPELIGQNKGAEIDQYDIVCKVGLNKINDIENYGSRCDVLFNGCFPNYSPRNELVNVNRVICPIKPCIPGILDVHKRDIWGHYQYLKNILPHIQFNAIGLSSCDFDNKYKTRATLGTFSINFLLKQDLKKLGVYGFTWYKNGVHHPHYSSLNKVVSPHGFPFEIEINGLREEIKISNVNIYLNREVNNVFNSL